MNFYIDGGANWGNTLRLAEDLFPNRCAYQNSSCWRTVAFEASPFIQPFVEQQTRWLNGELENEPDVCLPRSGSTPHLNRFAPLVGCPNSTSASEEAMRRCMFVRFDGELRKLKPSTALNSSTLVHERLAGVLNSRPGSFTHIPAAVGTQNAFTHIYTSRKQDIRGGATPRPSDDQSVDPVYHVHNFVVPVVDVASWIVSVARPDDFVFLKLDVEGAEHGLLRRLEQLGGGRLIDAVALECHGSLAHTGPCGQTHALLRRWQTRGTLVFNESSYGGVDNATRNVGLSSACVERVLRAEHTHPPSPALHTVHRHYETFLAKMASMWPFGRATVHPK